MDKNDLAINRHQDLKVLSEEEYQKIMIFFANFIQDLGLQLKVRQQVIATATVYFKRFYCMNSLKSIDPLLMAPTCIFLASKVEEFGVISASRLVSYCQQVVKNKFTYAWNMEFPYRAPNIQECEFFLLELMDCCLILYHPYRPLIQYCADLDADNNELLSLSWSIVNDSLRTDISLLYPPYLIALSCIYMACVVQNRDARTWFAELSVDMEIILDITKLILHFYELWKNYEEKKEIGAILQKMPKPKVNHSGRASSQGQDNVQ